MRSLIFDSDDLGVTEEFLNRVYTKMSIGNDSENGVSTRIRRNTLGQVNMDLLNLGFSMRYDADPLEKVCLCAVETGAIEENYRDAGVDVFLPGDVGLLTPPDLPYSGMVRSARYRAVLFDPELLERVGGPSREHTKIQFTGHRPVNAAAAKRLARALAHLDQLAADPEVTPDSLVATTASDYLAAIVLDTMPTTARTEPTAVDRCDAHGETARRAIAYIETHIHQDISIADIAAACFVTTRSVQLAFRRHLNTTPTAYMKRLRLYAAHEELRAASPADGHTVTSIAQRWGFAHPGRFAIAYRRAYGQAPSTTLNG
ncbi:helix-turn-helix transcriptional regulator [Nocardia sp. CDC153]|uniref:helix-turn-helix transcriptional regulator n=1 Tax=Nocardia sp. CDC153 TaxID=3112167 RepID=UPI002DBDA560|nr:helix-turn-helix transcriptional regulator [Nocardia sp. CDC153]MEC3951867.1 helix-turn-helix transcriptional regulator [Nocardia sp. CDC153]